MENTRWASKAVPAARTNWLNPIRSILEKDFKVPENHEKSFVNLTLGEPTKANGYPLPEVTKQALIDAVESEKYNGYTHSSGMPDARQAVVDKYSTEAAPFAADDVLLTFGCSGAYYTVFSAMCEPGDNVLVPSPGFPLCQPVWQNLGIEMKHYQLDSEKDFDIKLDTLESQIDEKTKFILVINPSNPCGSVFSKSHMEEIIAISEKHQIPIVADEIYYGFSHDEDKPFHSFAHVNTTIPIITLGAISKIYGVPGWRLGWITVYNRGGYFDDILAGMQKLCMIWLHPTSVVQRALITILKEVSSPS
jgi:tyrosine aminotransferase